MSNIEKKIRELEIRAKEFVSTQNNVNFKNIYYLYIYIAIIVLLFIFVKNSFYIEDEDTNMLKFDYSKFILVSVGLTFIVVLFVYVYNK